MHECGVCVIESRVGIQLMPLSPESGRERERKERKKGKGEGEGDLEDREKREGGKGV